MNTIQYDRAKEQLKGRLEDYLQQKGINTRKPFNCLNPAHNDNTPSMNYDRKRNKVHCFSCNADYDIIDLIMIDYNLSDTAEAFKRGYEMFGIYVEQNHNKNERYTHNTHNTHNTDNTYNTDNTHKSYASNPVKPSKDVGAYLDKCKQAYSKTSYLQDRGISKEVSTLYNIGYDDNFYFVSNDKSIENYNAPAIIIPTGEGSYIARCTDNTKPTRYNKRGTVKLFNIDVCEKSEPVVIVEGEIDALSIIEAGYNAVALGSTANAPKLAKYTEEHKTECVFILALDNDNAGMEAQNTLSTSFDAQGIKYVVSNVYGQYKDANEALLSDKEALITSLQGAYTEALKVKEAEKPEALEEYKKEYASSYIKDFLNGIKEKANTPYIPTGFKELDSKLDGGLFEGLYFIGAISSLGKTTFTLQMADQIAQQGYDVIIFSLEMARNELIAKSISRLTLLNAPDSTKAKTTRGITTYSRYPNYSEQELSIITKSVKDYSDFAKHIVIHEGQGDIGAGYIRQAIEKHINLTGNKPIVFIDYLQIIAPYNDRATDKQNTDKAVTELKRISRDCKIPIIAISSLNRDNYSSKISMQAFKESGAIEYSSDVLIGLQFKGQGDKDFDIDEAKAKSNDKNSPRDIELKILKNRNGRTGDSLFYKYHALFNYFKEVEG